MFSVFLGTLSNVGLHWTGLERLHSVYFYFMTCYMGVLQSITSTDYPGFLDLKVARDLLSFE